MRVCATPYATPATRYDLQVCYKKKGTDKCRVKGGCAVKLRKKASIYAFTNEGLTHIEVAVTAGGP